MKNILRYVAIFLAVVFLVGCAPKEMTKTFAKDYGQNLTIESKLTYKEKSDVVDKQETRNSFKNFDENNKITFKDQFEKDKDKYSGIEGVEFKIEENGNDINVIFVLDYTKADLNKLVEAKLVPEKTLSEDKKSVSLQKVEETMKEIQWEEKK